ncbi:hypothetical protein GWK16_21250 [Roseomonas sp. JC162]|uniref:ABC-type transport auxiliary lipoprotein component domain-containing protein n=1 Tax=Neoroseomonas marina TaxID=1232220 RepID=A0A848EK77_9PROT|nr:hypothetical protein [Neoroseomonas marina]NMJ43788.1 hypothetical protein [Neoroseomonas marina]
MPRDMMPRRWTLVLPLLALAGACSGGPVPYTTLPVDPALGFADPTRQAIIHAAYVFPRPASLQGRTAEAAQGISEAEHLTVELRHGARWIEMSPLASMAFEQARPEWRGALGIPAEAAPQAVIDALTRVRNAVAANDQAAAASALAPPVFVPGGTETLDRLTNLPPLPRTAWAASLTLQEMWRMQRQNSRSLLVR